MITLTTGPDLNSVQLNIETGRQGGRGPPTEMNSWNVIKPNEGFGGITLSLENVSFGISQA